MDDELREILEDIRAQMGNLERRRRALDELELRLGEFETAKAEFKKDIARSLAAVRRDRWLNVALAAGVLVVGQFVFHFLARW